MGDGGWVDRMGDGGGWIGWRMGVVDGWWMGVGG